MKPAITPISIPTIAATTKAPTRTIRLYFFLDLLLVIAADALIRLDRMSEPLSPDSPVSQGIPAARSEI